MNLFNCYFNLEVKIQNKVKRIGVFIGINILISIALFFSILYPRFIFLRKLENQSMLLKKQIKKQEREIDLVGNYKSLLMKSENLLKTALNGFSKNYEFSSLLDEIYKIGFSNQLQFKIFKPMLEQENQKNNFARIPMQITVLGNYKNLLKFITQLSELPELVVSADFTLKPVTPISVEEKELSEEKLILNMMIETYRYEK